ncbi:MAG: hypothetical protein P4L55_14265 [Syntrophobacteraceae bacterium]|nr:hypothetical protein [Syntrophobacteraceae bacterium]
MLTTSQSYVTYQGNGATAQFPYSFPVARAAYLQVSITDNNVSPPATAVLSSSQYSVTGIGNGIPGAANPTPGGVVTYPLSGSVLPAGWTITIQRVVPYQQNTSLENQGGFYPQVVEAALDNLTMQTQQLATQVNETSSLAPYIIQPLTLPANLTTQSLAGLFSVYVTANSQGTTITGFSDMTAGNFFKIIFGDGNTTIAFATWWSGLAAGSIIGHQGQSVTFAQGDVLDCVTDGAYVYVIDSNPMVPAILPPITGLIITNDAATPYTKLKVTSVSITMANAVGVKLCQTWAAGPESAILPAPLDATTLGAGGLDTGTLAAGAWYYVWAIGDGTHINLLLSSAGSWANVNKTYISGFSYARLIGCALTDSSAHFIRFHQYGNKFLFDVPISVTLASQASYTQYAAGPFPLIAAAGLFQIVFFSQSGQATFGFSADGANDYFVMYAPATGAVGQGQFELPFLTAKAFWYKNSNISATPGVNVRGFTLNL